MEMNLYKRLKEAGYDVELDHFLCTEGSTPDFFFVKEERSLRVKEQVRNTFLALKTTFREKRMWLLAFFLFFWTFSPSFGAPFF